MGSQYSHYGNCFSGAHDRLIDGWLQFPFLAARQAYATAMVRKVLLTARCQHSHGVRS
jgi:hypothetical protein